MQVQVWQAALFGLLACLASMPGLGGTVLGNYTLGRPLVAGLIVGLIMGDVQTGIYLGAAIQVVYIALVTPGGTVSADVRAISYIGIPLSMVAVHSMGLNPASAEGQAMAVTLGSAVGTIGTVLFYGTATVNLVWQHMGWRALEKGDLRKLYVVDMGLPWISHILCSFIPTFIITKVGTSMVDLMKAYLPMDGVAMKTLFTVGSLLPAVGIAILLIEHDMSLVMSVCQRIQVLDYGRTIASGTPEEIANNPQVISAYLGSDNNDDADGDSTTKAEPEPSIAKTLTEGAR